MCLQENLVSSLYIPKQQQTDRGTNFPTTTSHGSFNSPVQYFFTIHISQDAYRTLNSEHAHSTVLL